MYTYNTAGDAWQALHDHVTGKARLTEEAAHAAGEEIDQRIHPDQCPACGDPGDYCRGHGKMADPVGYAILSYVYGDESDDQ